MTDILDTTEHRPWPLPNLPWIMTQTWCDLLFAHWPLPAEVVRPHVPTALELDTFDGDAWIGVVPFYLTGVRFRDLVPIPFMSRFIELNVRTYVVHDDKPGVYFFSLDASSRVAVAGARRFFHLPYFNAEMSVQRDDETIIYASRRTHRSAPAGTFRGTYRPESAVFRAEEGSLDKWLTERYCLYSTDSAGNLYRGDIHHLPWPLQSATASILDNTVTPPGIDLPETEPLLHFARKLKVYIWPPVKC